MIHIRFNRYESVLAGYLNIKNPEKLFISGFYNNDVLLILVLLITYW